MRNALVIALLIVLIVPAGADSLYSVADGAGGNSLFTDAKAHRVGDILTVVIDESASGTTTAATATSKTDSASIGGTGNLSLFQALGLTGNTGYNATGSTTRTDALTATIAVTVMQVFPNGTMLVQGTRSVGTNNDVQHMTLTGIIREQDVSPANTVPSPLVADAKISYGGKGPVADPQHEGVITRIFKFLF